MGLIRKPTGLGAAVLGLLAALGAVATAGAPMAAAAGSVPIAGDWEGIGSHGLPLSFVLARRHGRLLATSIAVGSPQMCPAKPRNAEAVPLSAVTYSGPGAGRTAENSGSAVLSGYVPGQSVRARLFGAFSSPQSGTFSIQLRNSVRGCGWPARTLTWQVHPVQRQSVSDGTWIAPLTGSGITSGSVRLVVAAQGKVVESLRSTFSCQTASVTGTDTFDAATAYDFIGVHGGFASPTRGNRLKGHPTTWSGRFTRAGGLRGSLDIYDVCTKHPVQAQFSSQ